GPFAGHRHGPFAGHRHGPFALHAVLTRVRPAMPLSVSDIVALHDAAPERWEEAAARRSGPASAAVPLPALDEGTALLRDLVEAEHFANFTIWGLEDEARRRDGGDAKVAAVKRAIDPWNQRRNDLMEAIDATLLERFSKVNLQASELHSETAGMMIDRLSILALKIRNMDRIAAEEAAGGGAALAAECEAKARVLRVQREDLAGCLAKLLEDFAAGRRHFKSYLQMKSYNDDRLNPVLRAAAGKPAGATAGEEAGATAGKPGGGGA
ncbi:MAG: DUF4254 domain-containing protein, partial [Candidatus Binatia bacterium]